MANAEDAGVPEPSGSWGVETCPCDLCVFKTVAAKMSFLLAQERHAPATDDELERTGAFYLSQALDVERSRRTHFDSPADSGGVR